MSIPSTPTIFDKDLWGQGEERVLDLCARSLRKLRDCPNVRQATEPEINRKLFLCMAQTNRDLITVGKGFDHLPQPEAANLPDSNDERRADWERKIPDFQWQIIDHLAPAVDSVRCYAIECKRLGTPPRRDWILNEEYVTNGMCRFANESHRYGNRCRSGAMIGYMQSMSFHSILSEVNEHARTYAVGELAPIPGASCDDTVKRLHSLLCRSFPVSPFHLRHMWVDLRSEEPG
ncbi:MAG: hypothetical protein WCK89_11895 [bacterium]